MTCPSCSSSTPDNSAYCFRCGFALERYGARVARWRGTLTWVLRRSLAGFAAGLAGWWVIPGAGRAAGASLSQTGHLLLTGGLGGIFLGTVEGMMEDSLFKTLWGGVSGLVGGLLGSGLVALLIQKRGAAESSTIVALALVITWGIGGACIGLVSAWMERHRPRMIAGVLAGLIGGALGGWLGYQMYGSLADIPKVDQWLLRRMLEALPGAILGAVLWCVIGLAERFFIFRRRWVTGIQKKTCERCRHANALNAWYCTSCGAVLQEAAPPESLQLPKRQALARFISACQYLGKLCATTSIVVAALAAVFLGSINVFLGLFGMLATALAGYIGNILFNALAEALSPLL